MPKFKVLIIEDNFPIRKLFTTILKKNLFEVAEFDNASDGIEWLKSNKPDIILLDILLPDITGTDALLIIKNMNGLNDVPVIAITGFAADDDRDKYLGLGFSHYMTKPVNVVTFADEINSFIIKFNTDEN
ncbi:hypothetical protein MASR1M45_29840 [Candidatus Kapaibacterium sp.]